MNKLSLGREVVIIECRPTILIVLASLFVFLSVFDNTVVLSGIPMLRNPAAVAALLLVMCFVVFGIKALRMTNATQWLVLGFLLCTLSVELIRILMQGSLFPGWIFLYFQWVQVLVLFFILLDIAKDPRTFHYLGISFLLAILYISFLAVVAPDGFEVIGGQRLGYGGENLNRQAYWYAMAAVIFVWWLIERWPRVDVLSILLLLGAGLELYCILKSGSRAAFIAMLSGISCLIVINFRREKLSAYLILLPIMVVGSLWMVFNNDLVIGRLMNAWQGSQDGMRGDIYTAAWELFLKQPFLGYGVGFADILGNKLGLASGLTAHNSLFRVVLNFGILAGVAWVGMIASIIWRCVGRKTDPICVMFLSLIVLSLVYGLFDELQFNKFFWVMLALASQSAIYSIPHIAHRLEVRYATAP